MLVSTLLLLLIAVSGSYWHITELTYTSEVHNVWWETDMFMGLMKLTTWRYTKSMPACQEVSWNEFPQIRSQKVAVNLNLDCAAFQVCTRVTLAMYILSILSLAACLVAAVRIIDKGPFKQRWARIILHVLFFFITFFAITGFVVFLKDRKKVHALQRVIGLHDINDSSDILEPNYPREKDGRVEILRYRLSHSFIIATFGTIMALATSVFYIVSVFKGFLDDSSSANKHAPTVAVHNTMANPPVVDPYQSGPQASQASPPAPPTGQAYTTGPPAGQAYTHGPPAGQAYTAGPPAVPSAVAVRPPPPSHLGQQGVSLLLQYYV